MQWILVFCVMNKMSPRCIYIHLRVTTKARHKPCFCLFCPFYLIFPTPIENEDVKPHSHIRQYWFWSHLFAWYGIKKVRNTTVLRTFCDLSESKKLIFKTALHPKRCIFEWNSRQKLQIILMDVCNF